LLYKVYSRPPFSVKTLENFPFSRVFAIIWMRADFWKALFKAS
jgi:hypothetical protein